MNLTNDFPLLSFHFKVEIDGKQISFQEVSGLDFEAEVLEYRHGREVFPFTRKKVGMYKTSTISMKKGIFSVENDVNEIFDNLEFFNDYFQTNGKTVPIEISLMDEVGSTVGFWSIPNAVPVKLSGPSLKSDSNEVAIESIEFAHDGISAFKF